MEEAIEEHRETDHLEYCHRDVPKAMSPSTAKYRSKGDDKEDGNKKNSSNC